MKWIYRYVFILIMGVFCEGLKFCLTRKKNINFAAVCFHYVQRNSKILGGRKRKKFSRIQVEDNFKDFRELIWKSFFVSFFEIFFCELVWKNFLCAFWKSFNASFFKKHFVSFFEKAFCVLLRELFQKSFL